MYFFLDAYCKLLFTGRSVAFPGHALGSGLTPDAAKARTLTKNSLDNGALFRLSL